MPHFQTSLAHPTTANSEGSRCGESSTEAINNIDPELKFFLDNFLHQGLESRGSKWYGYEELPHGNALVATARPGGVPSPGWLQRDANEPSSTCLPDAYHGFCGCFRSTADIQIVAMDRFAGLKISSKLHQPQARGNSDPSAKYAG